MAPHAAAWSGLPARRQKKRTMIFPFSLIKVIRSLSLYSPDWCCTFEFSVLAVHIFHRRVGWKERSGGRAKRPPIEHTDPVPKRRKLWGFHYIFPSERSSSWRQEEGAGALQRLACNQQFRERRRRTLSFPNSPILSPSKPYLVLRDTLCSCEAYGMRPQRI